MPINGNLPTITVRFMHYGSFIEAKECWKRRTQRMLEIKDKARIFVINNWQNDYDIDINSIHSFNKIQFKKLPLSINTMALIMSL